ncbi:MAG: GAF domain-containing sensor histidine kinase [Candidatus Krumholzibacteriota bacterium]|nr:GAF domain-containing sensor histidine kinase [Candidatus Krumholzibacteriota bacterium]
MAERPNVEYLDPTKLARTPDTFSAAEAGVLDEVNRRVAAGQSLDAVMDWFFAATRAIHPCDRIGLAFLEEGGRRLVAGWTRTLYEPVRLRDGYAEDLRGSSLERVLREGSVRIIHDLARYGEEHPDSVSTKLLRLEGVASNMTCPLTVEGRRVGVMFRSSREAGVYDAHQARLHLAVAERLGQAVEKAWRIEQLEAANRAYTEMLGFVSHELKSPLASLVMDAELLTEGLLGALSDEQAERVRKMAGKAHYLMGLVKEYLDLARVEGGGLALDAREDVDFVGQVLEPSVELIAAQLAATGARLERDVQDPMPGVECDPELLKIVLVNLLGNAVKYGREADGQVRVAARVAGGALRVSVWNAGPGFPPEARSRLFKRFSRVPSAELMKRRGTGVGLYTAWRIVQLHGGRIRADSREGEWAEFAFTIPQPLGAMAGAEDTAP